MQAEKEALLCAAEVSVHDYICGERPATKCGDGQLSCDFFACIMHLLLPALLGLCCLFLSLCTTAQKIYI